MSKWIKRSAVLSALCFMLMTFAACGGEDGKVKNSPDDKKATDSPAATSTVQPNSPTATDNNRPDATDSLGDDLGDIADDVGDVADDALDGAGDIAEDAGDAVGDAARGAGEAVDDFMPETDDERNASHLMPGHENNNTSTNMTR